MKTEIKPLTFVVILYIIKVYRYKLRGWELIASIGGIFMKKLISSTISVMTSLTMLACGCISTTFADSDVIASDWDPTESTLYLGDIDTSELNLTSSPAIYSNYNFGSYNYGAFLDMNNMAVYRAFKKLEGPTVTPLTVKLPMPIAISVSALPETPNATEEDQQIFEDAVFGNCKPGIDAALFDLPELYWIDPNKMSVGVGKDTRSTYSKSKEKYYLYISSIIISPALLSGFESIEEAEEYGTLLDDALENFPVSGETRYEQLKSIHDYIAKFTYYDLNGKFSGSSLGAMVEPGVVCEGYSEAFKLICDRLDIPCVCVFGNLDVEANAGHMWNYVQMDDNKWYAIDVTWDDTDGKGGRQVKYDYFLKGSESFFTNHTPEPDYGITKFYYPEISSSDYVFTPVSQTTTTTTTTTTTSSATSSASKPTTTSTSTTTTAKPTTTSTATTAVTTKFTDTTTSTTSYRTTTAAAFTSTSTTLSSTTSLLTSTTTTTSDVNKTLVGDINHDGEVNVADLVYLQSSLLGKIKPKYSCDCNNDGVADVFDLIFMRKILI